MGADHQSGWDQGKVISEATLRVNLLTIDPA